MIDFFRVERHLRSMFATNGWKHFGIVAKMDPAVIPYASVMVDPQLWGRTGGVTLSIMEYDANGQPHPKVIGESNLLALFLYKGCHQRLLPPLVTSFLVW